MNGPDKIIIGIHGVGDQSDGTIIVWHRYIRHDQVREELKMCGAKTQT